jgi:SAM-dependent methyltransferase
MVDGLSISHIYDEIDSQLTHIRTDLDIQNIDFDNVKTEISRQSQALMANIHAIDALLKQFQGNLQGFVDSIERPYYTRSEDLYRESLRDTPDYILDQLQFKNLLYEPETKDFFINRVRLHTDYKWPAMEIRPGHGEITETLVSCDPLYLVDTHDDLFKVMRTLWTPEYQRRVRYYTIDETQKKILHQLPHKQFGLIVAVNFFNFRPLKLIEKYTAELFSLLKPGGVAIFTYNNCDYPIGVDNFENSYYCYTPGKQIKKICEQAGFRIMASFDMENNVSWLELQRPGRLTSLRGGQTLGKIQTI